MRRLQKFLSYPAALAAGVLNGLLGSGGGLLLVPAFSGAETKNGGRLPANKAHAGAVAVMLPLSVLSALLYLFDGRLELSQALPYVPGGVIGAVLGAALLKKISPRLLKKLFALLAIYAGGRFLLR